MRILRAFALGLVVWLSIGFGATQVHAQDRDQALRHLEVGVTFYKEQNYQAALVEFEASYEQFPSSAALQNIALCQTKLFRYVEAIETLEQLRDRFGSDLSADEVSRVESALHNLSRLVGTVALRVSPPMATVKLDGRALKGEALRSPLRLSSGEYSIEVVAPGHVPTRRVLKVVAGEAQTIGIELQRAVGQLTVRLDDEEGGIVLDRELLGHGSWSGEVLAGERFLQIFKPGHQTLSKRFEVRAGDRMDMQLVVGPLGEADEPPPGYDLIGLPYRRGKKTKSPLDPDMGWFGLLSASNLAVLRAPDGFENGAEADVTGGAFGIRGGYRFGLAALEGVFDTGSQSVSGTIGVVPSTYDLRTYRGGGNVRLLLGGRSVRLSSAVGVGAVWHRLDMDGRSFAGANSYASFELGPQFNVGQILIEAMALAFLEGANNTRDGNVRVYTKHTILPQVGVGLRVGFGQWGTW